MAITLTFTEQMSGYFTAGETDARTGEDSGRKSKTTFGFGGKIGTTDLDAFLQDPEHHGTVSGTYEGTLVIDGHAVNGTPFTNGVFKFMAPGTGSERLMVHEHTFVLAGRTYTFYGQKEILNDPQSLDEIHDVTTLYSTITDDHGKIVAAGVLHFPMSHFLQLVASFTVTGTDDKFGAKMRFLKFFLGTEIAQLLSGFKHQPQPSNVRRLLSMAHDQLANDYDVVIVGSGYGGGVHAARLAAWTKDGKRKRVAVLERGKEWRAGDFPFEPWAIPGELKSSINPGGLFEFHLGSDMDVLVGNGLGGTSLINANVMMEPDLDVFTQAGIWPRDLPPLDLYYARAASVLRPTPDPRLPLKYHKFAEGADACGPTVRTAPTPIAVTFEDTGVHADTGNAQTACIGCGGCITGCNYTSKNTVDMTYLSIAAKEGAEIFTNLEVRTVEQVADGYVLHLWDHEGGRARDVKARQVVLSAGSMGTFAILERSRRQHALKVPNALGSHFSGNGDVLGFGYNTDEQTDIGVGPTITGIAHFDQNHPDVEKRFILEEGAIPRALTAVVRGLLPVVKESPGDAPHTWTERLREWMRVQADRIGVDAYGALNHSLVYLGMGFESRANLGTLELHDDEVKVSWPDVDRQPFAHRIDDKMHEVTNALGGIYVHNPEPRSFLTADLLSVHPLGGVPMGDDADRGVVNGRGEVFGHEGRLFVADGSIIPTPLGINPAFTISAISEWIAENILKAWTAAG